MARIESFRVPIDCAVDLRLDPASDWHRTSASNISMSGMFLRSAEMHPRGAVLDIKFVLQNGQPPIEAQVEVLWSRVRDFGPEAPKGLGVRFLELDLESKYTISRLVERYQQLGKTPFQLLAAEAEDEPPPVRARSWRALALAFLAGVVTGAAGSFWLLAGSDLGGDTGVVQASELAPKAARPMAPAEAPAVMPEDPAAPAGDAAVPAEDATKAVEAAIVSWARAWAAKDVERYLGAYAAEFRPPAGRSLDAWQAARRERLARPGEVEIGVSGLEVEILDPGRAVARFDQVYAAPNYRDRVRKELELRRQDAGWRVLREDVLEKLPLR